MTSRYCAPSVSTCRSPSRKWSHTKRCSHSLKHPPLWPYPTPTLFMQCSLAWSILLFLGNSMGTLPAFILDHQVPLEASSICHNRPHGNCKVLRLHRELCNATSMLKLNLKTARRQDAILPKLQQAKPSLLLSEPRAPPASCGPWSERQGAEDHFTCLCLHCKSKWESKLGR